MILLTANTFTATAADMSHGADNFYKSDNVISQEIKFKNIYGMEVVGTLFIPKQMHESKKCLVLIVGRPFAAVRQQSANLYAIKMVKAGFITLTFEQSFLGKAR